MPFHRKNWRGSLAVAAVSASLLLSPLVLGASSAQAAPAAPAAPGAQPLTTSAGHKKLVNRKLTGGLATSRVGRQSVFVQLDGKGAADTATATLEDGKSRSAARAATQTRRRSVQKAASSVVAEAKTEDARTKLLFQVSNAVPGVAISATTEALEAVAERSDVVRIPRWSPRSSTTPASPS